MRVQSIHNTDRAGGWAVVYRPESKDYVVYDFMPGQPSANWTQISESTTTYATARKWATGEAPMPLPGQGTDTRPLTPVKTFG